MDSLPVEIIEIIFMFVNPKDYTNFVLSYDIASLLWRNKKIRERYKEQYLRIIREDFPGNLGIHTIKTIRVDNGKRHGKYNEYRMNCQLSMDATYRNGQMHGKCSSYYENGRLCMSTMYQNGERYGEYTVYYNGEK
jgi:antitoxin component YwqK of YwqJK toxin-antitoxin module